MIMAAVSAGTSELKGSLSTLQGELRAQRTELDRQKSFLGFSHIDNIGGWWWWWLVVGVLVVVVPFDGHEALGLMTAVLVWTRHHCHLVLVLVLVLRGVREVSFL